jgi:hypothetical protein
MILSRRGLILGATATLAAPAIVRAGSIMPVRAVLWTPPKTKVELLSATGEVLSRAFVEGGVIESGLADITLPVLKAGVVETIKVTSAVDGGKYHIWTNEFPAVSLGMQAWIRFR